MNVKVDKTADSKRPITSQWLTQRGVSSKPDEFSLGPAELQNGMTHTTSWHCSVRPPSANCFFTWQDAGAELLVVCEKMVVGLFESQLDKDGDKRRGVGTCQRS